FVGLSAPAGQCCFEFVRGNGPTGMVVRGRTECLGGTPDRAVRPRPQSTSGRGPQRPEDTDSGSRPPEKDKSRERTCQQKRPVETFGEEPGPLGGFRGDRKR